MTSPGTEIHVISVAWSDYISDLQAIRKTVFIDEQNVPQELEWDGLDADASHFLALNSLGQHLGCARLLPNGQIGRMAVLETHRGSGIGMLLLNAAVDAARQQALDRVFLHAQTYAEDFYRRGGFIPHGGTFEEAGIEHIAMEMKLPLAFIPASNSTPTPQTPITPARDSIAHSPTISPTISPTFNTPVSTPVREPVSAPQSCMNLEQALVGMRNVAESATREIFVFSPQLDHALFDDPETVDCFSAFARSSSRARVEIILQDSKLVVDRGHRLLDLVRRLDQKMAIRRLGEPFDQETSTFLVADRTAYWLLPSFSEYEGVWDLGAPVTAKRLAETFVQAWQKSREDPELRTLAF